ncbi:MAG: hypothetical protein J2P40_03875, partial [Candidatus Dormibacteraeota bacterium]|nr:hypothetical protein [Candidatus Dormibacteraeota bacterium]MBO0760394.1 hypothetical protein [Candidatus Dormibacteraeota bacterium]
MAAEPAVTLTAPSAFLLPNLADDGLELAAPDEGRLETEHYDTPDLRLARWGCSLFHRAGEGWTLQLPSPRGGPARRLMFAGPEHRPPAEALSVVRAYVRRAQVRPVARLSTRRRRLPLRNGAGDQVGTIVDDDVSVLQGRRVTDRFRELEVEIPDGGTALLGPLVSRLEEAGATPTDGAPPHHRAFGPAA